MNSKPPTEVKNPQDFDSRAKQGSLDNYFKVREVEVERLNQQEVKITRRQKPQNKFTTEKQFTPHFICSVCHKDAGAVPVMVRGQVYCMKDYKIMKGTLKIEKL